MKDSQELMGMAMKNQRETRGARKVTDAGVDRGLFLIVDQFLWFEDAAFMLQDKFGGWRIGQAMRENAGG